MPSVAIVYHSGYGHTKRLAEAVARGAKSVAGTTVKFLSVDEVDANWDALNAADAMIFGCPTYMGSVSAPFKAFMDKTGRQWMQQSWKDKLAAGFTNSGGLSGDKFNTLVQLSTLAAQHGMIWISLGVLPDPVSGINRISASLGAMAQSAMQSSAENEPPEADCKTGEFLGKRVAEAAARWQRGKG